MNANVRFEYMAARFYKETGTMAPGKDDCLMSHTDEERSTKWREWIELFYSELFDRDSKNQWLSIDDDMPACGENVMVWDGCDVEIDFSDVEVEYGTVFFANDENREVTHWYPITAPPK